MSSCNLKRCKIKSNTHLCYRSVKKQNVSCKAKVSGVEFMSPVLEFPNKVGVSWKSTQLQTLEVQEKKNINVCCVQSFIVCKHWEFTTRVRKICGHFIPKHGLQSVICTLVLSVKNLWKTSGINDYISWTKKNKGFFFSCYQELMCC